MEKVCIFYQASAELPYVIQLYDEYKNKTEVTIIVVNVYSNFEFIKSLNLSKAKIHFCDWPCRNKNILLSIISIRKIIYNFWNIYLESLSEGHVFFFSASFDWVTAFFIRKFCLKKTIKVHYAGFNTTELLLKDGYEEKTINKGLSIKNYLLLFCLFLITGIWFDYLKKINCISFPFFKYGIQHEPIELNNKVIFPYKYNISSDNNIVLLFTSTWDYEGETIMNHVNDNICKIIKNIRDEGYQVAIKGHPRLGLAKGLENSANLILPHYVPAEFINDKNIKLVLGINSAAIIYFAKYSDVRVVSLLRILENISNQLVEDNISMLKTMCGNKLEFSSSLEELKSSLNKSC